MSRTNQVLNNNLMLFFSTTASNYELSIDSVDKKSKSIFMYYDQNGDNIIQKEEMEKLKNDLQSVNSDNNGDNFSSKEIRNYMKNIGIKSSAKLNTFISAIINNYKSFIKNNANGEIESFEQGPKGDCWLLSQLNALSQTRWGKDAIKNSVIKNQDTDSYTIKLSGVDFETTITQEDIQNVRASDKYSNGDLDVLLFEIATERYFKQEVDKGNIIRSKDVLHGNLDSGIFTMQYLITGKTGHTFGLYNGSVDEHRIKLENLCEEDESFKDNLKYNTDCFSNVYNDQETMKELIYKISEYADSAILCGFKDADDWYNGQRYSKEQKNDRFSSVAKHEFMIKNITKDSEGNIIDIELSNPWYSDIPIHKTLDEFLDQMSNISIITEEDTYDELLTGFMPCCVKIE